MFCQKCGNEINDMDTFCAFCGTKVQPNNNCLRKKENYNIQSINFKETVFGKFVTNYIKKPLSIYSLMKNEDTLKVSIGMVIGMPIIYGLFHMLYFVSFFKNLINNLAYYINNLLNTLGSSLGSSLGLKYTPSDFFEISDEISKIKDKIQSYVSTNTSLHNYFFEGIIIMFLIMLIAFVIVEICNAVILKNSISQKNIFFMSTVSFIPLVFALIVSNIVIYVSFIATLWILVLGLIMSLISLFGGILELNETSKDRAYWTILINNIAFVFLIPFLIKFGTSNVIKIIGNTINVIGKL